MGGSLDMEVVDKFAVDVLQAAGEWADIGCDGEGHPDGMPRGRIGILAHDEDADVVDRCREGTEDDIARGQPWAPRSTLGAQEVAERGEGLTLPLEHGHPRGVNEILQGLSHGMTVSGHAHRRRG